jgi:peptidyl-prolyl cis-trans isomerase B (cyclophilin B)
VPRPVSLLAALALAATAAACGSDEEKEQPGKGRREATTAPATRERTAPAGGAQAPAPRECRRVPAPRPKAAPDLRAPRLRLDSERTYRAVVDTNCGRFTITLNVERAPRTSASFVYLARRGLYDGTTFHRIVPGFVIQGGDPRGTGQGGPGYSVVEAPPGDATYTRGVVAMAKAPTEEPGTSSSQFFVVTGPDAQLPPEYAVLGEVTEGLDTVERIASEPVDAANPNPDLRERPTRPVVIRAVTITESR